VIDYTKEIVILAVLVEELKETIVGVDSTGVNATPTAESPWWCGYLSDSKGSELSC